MRGVVVAVALVAGCRRPRHDPPVLPPDMTWIVTSDDPLQWRVNGFTELTTVVRPPTSATGTAHIVVVLKLPPGQRISDGLPPPGSIAARVEYAGPAHDPDAEVATRWRVLDVRQFDWRADGRACTVLRPDGDGHLVGVRWTCGATDDARAGQLLADWFRDGHFAGPRSSAGRERAARHIVQINGCTGCHQPRRAEDRSVTALVQRGTDAGGLFSVDSVFRDEDPVERYRPDDSNRGDPWLRPVCPDSELDLVAGRCRDGRRPRLRLDLAGGLSAGAAHVAQLCASRRRLAELVTPSAAIRAAVAACASATR